MKCRNHNIYLLRIGWLAVTVENVEGFECPSNYFDFGPFQSLLGFFLLYFFEYCAHLNNAIISGGKSYLGKFPMYYLPSIVCRQYFKHIFLKKCSLYSIKYGYSNNYTNIYLLAAIAQWIRLRLPPCGLGFDPQAQLLCFCKLYFKRTKINKKRQGLPH